MTPHTHSVSLPGVPAPHDTRSRKSARGPRIPRALNPFSERRTALVQFRQSDAPQRCDVTLSEGRATAGPSQLNLAGQRRQTPAVQSRRLRQSNGRVGLYLDHLQAVAGNFRVLPSEGQQALEVQVPVRPLHVRQALREVQQ